MFLSRLEITGFKSFAQKTVFDFNNGMAAFVGPNGCGKSNVVDAVRWVLGEQKTSVLRSDMMENVIFNGSKSRKPLGLAEVTMTIRNTRQVLPTEYSEVTVTRRLFRNGESQYLLNKTRCRLKDITELFMDTGLGPDSYSVIELQMVNNILSGKVDERRHLFEEAAGVNKYKLRRREAERKLYDVEEKLVRIEDIVAEKNKMVNSLKRQAAKTRRHNKLTEELKEIEMALLCHEFHKAKTEFAALDSELDSLRHKKIKAENSYQQAENENERIQKEIKTLEEEHASVLREKSAVNGRISSMKRDMAVFEEKLSNLENDNRRLGKETAESESNAEELGTKLEKLEEDFEAMHEQKSRASEKLGAHKTERDKAFSIVRELRGEVDEKNESLINIKNRINLIKSAGERNRKQKESLRRKIESTEKEINSIEQQIEEHKIGFNETLSLRDELDEAIEDARRELHTAEEQKANLKAAMEKTNSEISARDSHIDRLCNSLEFLEGLVDSAESSKYLMKSKSWNPKAGKNLLGEAIGVDKDLIIAVDSALGDAVRYFIVDNRKEAFDAIEALAKNKKGKATFICLDNVPEIPEPEEVRMDGVRGRASEIVRAGNKLRNVLRAVLGDAVIVENRETAAKCLDENLAGKAVTLDGEVFTKFGAVRGGSASSTEGMTIGKIERIRKIRKDIASVEKEKEKLLADLENTKNEMDYIDLDELSENLRNAEHEKSENESRISSLIYKQEMLENNLSLLTERKEGDENELEQIEKEEGDSDTEAAELANTLREAEISLDSSRKKLSEADKGLAALEEETREAEMEYVRINASLNAAEKDISDTKKRISELRNKAQRLRQEIRKNNETSSQLRERSIHFEEDLGKLEKDDNELLGRKEYLESRIKSLREESLSFSGEIRRQRKDLEKQTGHVHSKELLLNEAASQKKNILSRAANNFNINLDEQEFEPDPEFSIEANRVLFRELNEKLMSLGPVNHMALQDYQEENEKLEFYLTQVEDLSESQKNLSQTITEINETAERKFQDTFEVINKNFQSLFKTLFGEEGESELRLSGDKLLDADISIIAKPPGKKPHSIEGISSGEKAMTAIALLFSVYLVKPSPFCILDEVDAPLDDANIDRFIGLINKFSENTQFLIVTHNKKTMQESSALYGITMEENGVSKVVSVRIDKDAA